MNFSINEVTPYSASILPYIGQYRNISGLATGSNSSQGVSSSSSTKSASANNNATNSGHGGGKNVYTRT